MPIDPVTQGALIQTGGSLLGGLIGGKDAKKAVKKQYKYQKEFAKNQLQWRVQDAKAAGLHPLFALGGGGGTSPTFMAGQSPMGSAIADSAAAIGSAVAGRPSELSKQLQSAQIQSINSQTERNQAEAALARSQAARVAQTANVTPSIASAVVDEALAPGTQVGATRVSPVETVTRTRGDESTQAGTQPLFSKYSTRTGRYMYGPRSDEPAEAFSMENLPMALIGLLKTSYEGVPYWLRKWAADALPERRTGKRRTRKQSRTGRR